MRVTRRGCRLVLRALTALALVVAPFSLSVDGVVVTKAFAGKGGNGGGNSGGNGGGNGGGNSGGNGNGNSGGNGNGNSGGNGNGNSGNGNGNSGNSGNGNGNSGNSGNGNGNSGNSSGNSGNSSSSSSDSGNSSASAASASDVDSHVNALTGDKVEATPSSIQVTHRNGMTERIENGRFRMEDKYGRTIVDRKATMADLNRLRSL